jgi:uncharacterized protein YdhG (YjbR/CyaY superfamily)
LCRPQATETISYGIPAFKYKGSLMWFAGFSDHCSLFPTASVIQTFKNDETATKKMKATMAKYGIEMLGPPLLGPLRPQH